MHHVASSRTKDPALAIAARSLLEQRTHSATIDDVVSRSALDHHWSGLFQYAALRVGVTRAAMLLTQLPQTPHTADTFDPSTDRALFAAHAASELYRRMRELVQRDVRALPSITPLHLESMRYWRAQDPSYDAALRQLRRQLSGLTAEVAELCCARGLEVNVAAQVVGIDTTLANTLLRDALEAAQRIGGKQPKSHDRTTAGMLAEAFLLDPRVTPARRRHQQIVRSGDVIAGRYEIDGLLGSGAFADVYRAHDRDVEGHVVALKMTRAEHHDERAVMRGLRELQLIASVFHPSVVQLKDHGWHQGHLWFVMPLYRGETLSQRLRRGALGRAEARAIFAPLAEALATMHRAGVLHQDIKPDNIFLADIDPSEGPDPEPGAFTSSRRVLPILLDLGVAAKDAEVVLAGTLAYLAPEVAARFAAMRDPAPVGPKADVFSLALTLRDALDPQTTSDAPLSSVDAFLSHRAVTTPTPPQDHALRDLRRCFARWLSASPDERPSAADFYRELAWLTAPEERKQRRLATLRWVLPTALALLSVFGVTVSALRQEAAQQRAHAITARSDAERASQRAASIDADLARQRARGRELEADIAVLSREYTESRLTREQLASHLAVTNSQLNELQERLERQEAHAAEAQARLDVIQAERERAVAMLTEAQQASQTAERQLERARERHQVEQAAAEQRREQMEARLSAMEVALEHARAVIARNRPAPPSVAPKASKAASTDYAL